MASGGSTRLVFGSFGRPAVVTPQSPAVSGSLQLRFPGAVTPLPLPAKGQGASFVSGIGVVGATANEHPVPIASVTKVMTALVVLRDHPLRATSGGPMFTMTGADHLAYLHDSMNNDSNLDVVAGERLSERQLLEALMIPSADNVADLLARWDAGSIPAFVKKMNALATGLGLHETHYADASGLSPKSRSTALDQVRLGAVAMANPTMVSIVDHRTAVFPVAGTVANFNPVVGQDGITGLKSGWTGPAQGCLVTAAPRIVGGRRVLVVSAALTQPLGLAQAGQVDVGLLDATTTRLKRLVLVRPGAALGTAKAPWAHSSSPVLAGSPVPSVVGWPGLSILVHLVATAPSSTRSIKGWRRGDTVATAQLVGPQGLLGSLSGVLSGPLPKVPAGYLAPSRSRK